MQFAIEIESEIRADSLKGKMIIGEKSEGEFETSACECESEIPRRITEFENTIKLGLLAFSSSQSILKSTSSRLELESSLSLSSPSLYIKSNFCDFPDSGSGTGSRPGRGEFKTFNRQVKFFSRALLESDVQRGINFDGISKEKKSHKDNDEDPEKFTATVDVQVEKKKLNLQLVLVLGQESPSPTVSSSDSYKTKYCGSLQVIITNNNENLHCQVLPSSSSITFQLPPMMQLEFNFLDQNCTSKVTASTFPFKSDPTKKLKPIEATTTKTDTESESTSTSTSASTSTNFYIEEFLDHQQCSILLNNCLLVRRRRLSTSATKEVINPEFHYIWNFVIQVDLKVQFFPDHNNSFVTNDNNNNDSKSDNLTSVLFKKIFEANYDYPFRLIYSREIRLYWDFFKEYVDTCLESSMKIEEETRAQVKSKLWNTKRLVLLTTSKFKQFSLLQESADAFEIHKMAQCISSVDRDSIDVKVETEDPLDLTFNPEAACRHGRVYEQKAIDLFLTQFGHFITDHCKVGLCIQPKLPYLGTSPDYLIALDGDLHIVEVKCPYGLYVRGQSIVDCIKSGENFYLEQYMLENDDEGFPTGVRVNRRNRVYFQMQGQLNLCNVERGILIVFVPPGDLISVFVQRDVPFFERMLRKLTRIWFTRILPRMAGAAAAGEVLGNCDIKSAELCPNDIESADGKEI